MNHVTNLFMEDLQFIMIASGLGEFYIIIIHHHKRIKEKVVGSKLLSAPLISKKMYGAQRTTKSQAIFSRKLSVTLFKIKLEFFITMIQNSRIREFINSRKLSY